MTSDPIMKVNGGGRSYDRLECNNISPINTHAIDMTLEHLACFICDKMWQQKLK
jgi:hypothetical protein